MLFRNQFAKDLEAERLRALSSLSTLDPTSTEYRFVLDKLTDLSELRPNKDRKPLSKDSVLNAVVNLTGIGLVLHYEKLNVVTSKAFSWIRRIN